MNIQEMTDWLDVLQDKFDAPYFEDYEKLQLLNRAQMDVVNAQIKPIFRGESAITYVELTSHGGELLRPLIEIVDVTTDANGVVSYNDLEASLPSVNDADNGQTPIMHVMNCYTNSTQTTATDWATNRMVRYLRHNDYGKFVDNFFKRPTNQRPRMRVVNQGLLLEPSDQDVELKVTILRRPVDMDIDANISCELPDIYDTHNMIVAIALERAGIASRDQVLAQMTPTA